MDKDDKVFSSDIERGQKPLSNNLYELLHFEPAQPSKTKLKENNGESCNFLPKTDKIYVPKKRPKFSNVKTVRDIRKEYEEDCQSYLPQDILKQENYLFASIRNGSLKRDKTLRLAKSLIKGDCPLSRSTWQMLTNINYDKHNNPTQFVLWNGSKIRVNGSKGGEKKFICNYDLAKKKIGNKSKHSSSHTQKSLLKTMTVNFKPGPLSRKKHLDKSHQKFNVGESELVKLPKIGLQINPLLGVAIEPTISDILTSNRQKDDRISENWALFAVSTLGTLQDSRIKQVNIDTITFDMSYANNQNQILMRRAVDIPNAPFTNCGNQWAYTINCDNNTSEVSVIVEDMLNAVEISLTQDEMYTGIDEPMEQTKENEANVTIATKDKPKKKICELQRLDVTVIRLSDSPDKETACTNPACTLGCFCASLQNKYNFKNHCGKFDCMFECTCDFSNYKVSSNIDDQNAEFIPGLLNLDSKINSKLAKEEKKFHQTIVLTQNDSILLKAKRRSLKIPKRYAECVDNIQKHSDSNEVSVLVSKIDCKHVEPWCMVHNLYKCFCKGRFIESTIVIEACKESFDLHNKKSEFMSPPTTENEDNDTKIRNHGSRKTSISSSSSNSDVVYKGTTYLSTCARTTAFEARRFGDSYYKNMRDKIVQMEANDEGLHHKLIAHINKIYDEPVDKVETQEFSNDSSEKPETENKCQSGAGELNVIPEIAKSIPNKEKLITWLEANYKHYKQRIESGKKSIPLEAPKLGKIALYPWEVILERYKKRKNYFVVTKQPPYRIYIAVELKNPLLGNCINIDKIPFNDLWKYPVTVKNFLDDATDVKGNFYILCGLSHCWELIGSVSKLRDRITSDQSDQSDSDNNPKTNSVSTIEQRESQEKDNCSYSFKNLDRDKVNDLMALNHDKNEGDVSKWFFIMVENDFSEIQFHSRGFFVKHENILKAINVARATGKTVRLSSQKFNQSNDTPQFGIYAIPHPNITCVFVGPYEQDEVLEIESVMTPHPETEKPSRGVWITTNKSDNIKVIDEPLLSLPEMKESEIITLDKAKLVKKRPYVDISQNIETSIEQSEPPEKTSKPVSAKKPSPVKVVKPIKIRKSNGFYQLATGSLKPGWLKSVSLLKPLDNKDQTTQHNLPSNTTSAIDEESFPTPIIQTTFSLSEVGNSNKSLLDQPKIKPIAEIAPQIKARTVANLTQGQSRLRGMLILKPEEINQRHSENKLFGDPIVTDKTDIRNINSETIDNPSAMDIENFLATSEVCVAPNIDSICIVSEEDETTPKTQDVWIECQNIPNLGCLKGRKNSKNEISFEFPGFKFTEFYPEVEAFTKIIQVLSRKVYIPKQINLQWKVVDREEDLSTKELLSASNLGPDYVLTTRGLINKHDMVAKKDVESLSVSLQYLGNIVSPNEHIANPLMVIDKATEVIKDLEEISKTLENESDNLKTDTSLKKSELLSLILQVPKEIRREVSENLRDLSN